MCLHVICRSSKSGHVHVGFSPISTVYRRPSCDELGTVYRSLNSNRCLTMLHVAAMCRPRCSRASILTPRHTLSTVVYTKGDCWREGALYTAVNSVVRGQSEMAKKTATNLPLGAIEVTVLKCRCRCGH